MNVGEHYKVIIGEDLNLNPEYAYFSCIAELEDYYLLHTFDYWLKSNGFEGELEFCEDLDEFKENFLEMNCKRFKEFNKFESVYYKSKDVANNPESKKRKFIIV